MLEEKFRAELSAQTRLASLYKSHSEEHNSKVEDMQSVVSNLQTLLRDANNKYSSLEEELSGINDKHKVELSVGSETVAALRKELENANKLIKTFKEKGLSEDSEGQGGEGYCCDVLIFRKERLGRVGYTTDNDFSISIVLSGIFSVRDLALHSVSF